MAYDMALSPRHTYGQQYTADQYAHADAVRAAREAGRTFYWVAQTAVQSEPFAPGYRDTPVSAAGRLRFLPGDLVWTARTGWVGR